MLQSEVYVFEVDKMIQGFVGLNNEYIEGIFVSEEMQSCGIGKLLLNYIKDKKDRLQLNVYQKNAKANSFYQREGFIIQCKGLDEATGEKEYTMLWKQKQKSEFDGVTIYEVFIFAWTRAKTRQLEQNNKRNESIEKQLQFEFIRAVLALNYAIDHPDKVKALVLIAANIKCPENY